MTLHRLGALLGRKVQTPDGVGTLISVTTPSDGLFVYDDQVRCCVWYGVNGRGPQNGWVKSVYTRDQIKPVKRGRARASSSH